MKHAIPSVPMLDVTVDTAQFRAALIACAVHASKNADLAHLHRIRCYIAPEILTVTAMDGYTAAAATCPVIAANVGALADVGHLDLAPSDVAKILAVFRVGKRKDGEDLEMLIRIQIVIAMHPAENGTEPDSAVHYVHLTDVSGLIPGETLELPMLPEDPHAPHVPSVLSTKLDGRPGVLDSFGISAEMIGRFAIAAKTYKRELLMTTTEGERPAVVVRCGPSFLGCVSPLRYPEEEQAKHSEWLGQWAERLPPAPAKPEDPE